jgi:hypothetical protein
MSTRPAEHRTRSPEQTSYQSCGRTIRVESFLPSASASEVDTSATRKKHPAVLVLYGASGLLLRKTEMESFSMQLASRGIAAFLIDYFNRTNTMFAGDATIHWHVRLFPWRFPRGR